MAAKTKSGTKTAVKNAGKKRGRPAKTRPRSVSQVSVRLDAETSAVVDRLAREHAWPRSLAAFALIRIGRMYAENHAMVAVVRASE